MGSKRLMFEIPLSSVKTDILQHSGNFRFEVAM
jgi:hypothetical protein